LSQSLVLQFPKKVYDFSSAEFMAFRSKKNQNAVNLCFRLITLTTRSMVEKNFGDLALSIKLPKHVNIRRCGIHS
jgi:hypothetical protein